MRFVLCSVVLAFTAGAASAQTYQFSLNPVSHVQGGLGLAATCSGSLVGTYDSATNPSGTHTKPGTTGPFDPAENVPVPITVAPTLSGNIDTPATGGFQMNLDLGSSLVGLSGLAVTMLGHDPLPMATGTPLTFDPFRTLNPTATYTEAQPAFGTGALVHRSVQQVGFAQGQLTPLGGGQYSFTIEPTLQLFVSFSAIGTTFVIEGEPVPMMLTGQITISGGVAHLTGSEFIAFEENIFQTRTVPRFGVNLPAAPPATQEAPVWLDVGNPALAAAMNATFTMDATGVPTPGAGLVLMSGGLLAMRRRR